MSDDQKQILESEGNPSKIQTETRTPRSIRFSDPEWKAIEKEAAVRGMATAELARHAAVAFATGQLASNSAAVPPEIYAYIERIFRGVYLLATIKRDEMSHEGRLDEFEKVRKEARKVQETIHENHAI